MLLSQMLQTVLPDIDKEPLTQQRVVNLLMGHTGLQAAHEHPSGGKENEGEKDDPQQKSELLDRKVPSA